MVEVEACPTAYGRPALELLAGQVSHLKGGDPLAPVTVVVASNYAAVSTRRALAARPGGVANVACLTLHRLAERLGAARLAAEGRRPVSAPVLAEAVRAELRADPGVFAPVAQHPATELALVAATRELAGVSATALDAVAARSPRAACVVGVARRVRRRLAGRWHDEHDLVAAASAAVGAGAPVEPVVLHLVQDLSPAAAAFVRALAHHGVVRAVVGLTGDEEADRRVLAAHARAGVAVPPAAVEPPCATAVVSTSDPDEEVRAAVRSVMEWMRAGVRLGRMALLYGTADPYARLLHEQLTAADIAHNGAPVASVGDMVFGRTLRALLSLPDRGLRRSEVLGVVAGAPLLAGEARAPSHSWERVSRAAGVVDGDDWALRLEVFARDQRRRADHADHEERERLAGHLRRDAERAEQLAAFVADLRADLAAGEAAGSWAEKAAWVRRLVEAYLGDERWRLRWPRDEQEAADRVEAVLDRLASLDAVGGPPPSTEVFRRTLEAELEVALRRVGRFGDGVLVGHVSLATGVELDRVVVLGMAEGAFPPRRLEDSLLPDDERRAAGGELDLRTERLHDDRRHLLAAVAAAGRATLSFPRGDLRRSGDRAASRWLLADAARLCGRASVSTADLAGLDEPWLAQVPSFVAGLARARFPVTEQDLRLAAMLRDPEPVVAADAVLAAGTAMARARRSDGFTRFDGNLAGEALPDYASSGVVSATRLQAWAECPHAFLLQHLLGVEVAEDPERRLEMDPLDKGRLVHEVLERFVAGAMAAGRRPPWDGDDRRRLLSIADEVCGEYEGRGAAGRPIFWRRDRARVVADLERFLAEDAAVPVAVEWRFDGAPYPLPDGRAVCFRGAVDRVDEGSGAGLTVVDYKTGGSARYQDLSQENPHLRGTHLQLAVYGTAVEHELGRAPVDACYWFVTRRGKFRRIGYPVTPAVRREVGTAIAAIVDGIRAGLFPLRPPAAPSYGRVDCWYCAPDGLSPSEARRTWEAKRADPALAAYVALAEPEALP